MLINYRNVRITTQFNFICKSDMPGPSQFVQLKDRHKSICVNADGRKLRVEHLVNDAGYRDSTGYRYYVKDYQGNVRAVVADDGTLEEVNSYYPYGMLHGPSAIAAGVQPCKYTGKVGAHGPMGVILQPETEKADILLSANALLVMKQNNFNVFSSKVRWAMAVYALFSNVGTLKYIQNVTK